MAFQRFESRFCAFEGPATWRIVPGLGMVDDSNQKLARSAVVMENWVDPPQSVSAYLETQVKTLKEERQETEVIDEQDLDSRHLSEAQLVTYRTPCPVDGALLQKQLVAVEGPLVCTLTVSGLEADHTLWNELCNPLLGSFTVPAQKWSAQIAGADIARFDTDSSSEATHDCPGLGLAIPTLDGWDVDAAGMLRRGNEAEIRIHCSGLAAGSAEECFAEALQHLSQTDGLNPTGWQHGETSDGKSFWAIEAAAVHEKTWGPSERHLHREVFIDDEGVLTFTLECVGESGISTEGFAKVLAGYCRLEPEKRRMRLGEPWLPVELAGQWLAAGPGVYVCSDPPGTIVVAQQFPKEGNLAKLVTAQTDAARRAPDVAEVMDEQRSEGPFRGCEACRYSLDFSDSEGNTASLRSCWLDSRSTRSIVHVRSGDAETADECLRTLLENFTTDVPTGDGGGQ